MTRCACVNLVVKIAPRGKNFVVNNSSEMSANVTRFFGDKKGCELREFLFLVRNTLQRVPKIHCLEFVQKTRGSDSLNLGSAVHASAAECRELVAELVGC